MLRHKVKPGITGWAQVNGLRGETETLDKMRARVRYWLHAPGEAYARRWGSRRCQSGVRQEAGAWPPSRQRTLSIHQNN